MKIIDLIYTQLETPSGQPGPLDAVYLRTVTACGHAMLGAAFCAYLGAWGLLLGLPLALAYWLVKERGDLRRGGDLWDGLEDTVMVSLGAWYGPQWWPVMVMGAMGYIMVSGTVRSK